MSILQSNGDLYACLVLDVHLAAVLVLLLTGEGIVQAELQQYRLVTTIASIVQAT